MSKEDSQPRVLLGHISGAHGIKGDVLIKSHTAQPESIGNYGPLTDAGGVRRLDVRVLHVTGKGIVARIKGVSDRTAAEKLKGTELYADRRQLPEPEEGEFYHADLIGLAAVDAGGKAIGEIVAVHNFGAGDLIEIRLAGSRATELIPFTNAFVPSVDVAARIAEVVMPVMTETDETEAAGGGADDAEAEPEHGGGR